VGAQTSGERAKAQLELGRPNVDFVKVACGLGVPAARVDTGEEFVRELDRAIREPGPHLIEVVIPAMFSPLQLRVMPHALRALGRLPRPIATALKRRLYP
jgi:acetolactate synthase-1/2/3 large subunit